MKLRKLELKDAPLMLEWMHDESVIKYMEANFAEKKIEDCKAFIIESWDNKENLHLAITDDMDTYMGTVSLKHVTKDSAEFAITMRRSAMGKGLSRLAMTEIIRIGFNDMKLKRVYWCVLPENKRAVRFYDLNGYERIDVGELRVSGYSHDQIKKYSWYQVVRKD